MNESLRCAVRRVEVLMRALPLLLLVSCAVPPRMTPVEARRFLDRFPEDVRQVPAGPEAIEAAVKLVTPDRAWMAHLELRRFAATTSDGEELERRFHEFEEGHDGPIVELTALYVAVEERRLGETPANAFLMSTWNKEPSMPRFVTLQRAALSWVERAGEGSFYEDAAKLLGGEIGRALTEYVAAAYEFNLGDEIDPVTPARLHSAAWAVVGLCPGTVLASAVWSDFIEKCAFKHHPATALGALDAWERAFGRAEFASEALWVVAYFADEPMAVIERALKDDPDGRAIPEVLALLADLHRKAGRETEMLRTAELVLNRPRPAHPPSQRFRLSDAKADVRKMLGEHFESRGDWGRALAQWEQWEPASFCGTCVGGMTRDKAYHIAICREALGRIDEAVELYWALLPETSENAMDAARRLKAVYTKRGKLKEFRAKAQAALDELRRDPDARIKESAAARILAEEER